MMPKEITETRLTNFDETTLLRSTDSFAFIGTSFEKSNDEPPLNWKIDFGSWSGEARLSLMRNELGDCEKFKISKARLRPKIRILILLSRKRTTRFSACVGSWKILKGSWTESRL
jgi:hypothetical protein